MKKVKNKIHTLPWSKTVSTFMIFVLSFVNLGLIYTYSTQAAAGYTVQMVHLCTRQHCQQLQDLPSEAIKVQNWYTSNAGRTFALKDTAPGSSKNQLTVYTPLTTAQFISMNYNDQYNHVFNLLQSKGYINSYRTVVVELGFAGALLKGFPNLSESNLVCGLGAKHLAITAPLNSSSKKSCSNRRDKLIAHELGHTFGLQHIAQHNSNLMGSDCHPVSKCTLNSSQKQTLASSLFLTAAAPKK